MTTDDELKQFRAQQLTRRALLGKATQGLGALALASLEAKASPLLPSPPPNPGRRVGGGDSLKATLPSSAGLGDPPHRKRWSLGQI